MALVLLAMIVLLRAEGRMFLCACGQFAVWVSDWCSSNTSQQLLDPYSFTHVLHGFLFFWLIALLFVAAMLSFIASLVAFVREIFLAVWHARAVAARWGASRADF